MNNTFAGSLKLQISVLHQSMCICKSGLSCLMDDWGKYKEKVPDVSNSNQNVEITCNSKITFIELEDYPSKGCRKTNQRRIMFVANTAILKLNSNFQRKILLQLMGFCFDWWALLLLTLKSIPRRYKVNDAKTFTNLVVSFYALRNYMYIADWLI